VLKRNATTTKTRNFIEEAFNNAEEKQLLLATCGCMRCLSNRKKQLLFEA